MTANTDGQKECLIIQRETSEVMNSQLGVLIFLGVETFEETKWAFAPVFPGAGELTHAARLPTWIFSYMPLSREKTHIETLNLTHLQ